MNKDDLKIELNKLGINPNLYSLEGDFIPDAIVLYQSYNNWEVFYFSERGEKDRMRIFSSENDACSYIYKILKDSNDVVIKYGLNR